MQSTDKTNEQKVLKRGDVILPRNVNQPAF